MDEPTITILRNVKHVIPLSGSLPINGKQKYMLNIEKESKLYYPRLHQPIPVGSDHYQKCVISFS